MGTLNDLGLKYGTDKSSAFHGYLDTYETYFYGMDVEYLLEIGVCGGNSLRMWEEFFPFATIFGVDIDPKMLEFEHGPMVQPLVGDASTPAFWEHFKKCWPEPLDVIVDDGSHTSYSIVQGLTYGFPLLRPGGLYCIEDLHAVYLAEYNRDNRLLRFDSDPKRWNAMHFLSRLVDERLNLEGAGQTGAYRPDQDIGSIHFHKSICFIRKL